MNEEDREKITDSVLRALYKDVWIRSGRRHFYSREFPRLDSALTFYALSHNCTYDEALIFAKTGRRVGRLREWYESEHQAGSDESDDDVHWDSDPDQRISGRLMERPEA